MNCHNKECHYWSEKYVGNCWDFGEAEDCEESDTEDSWERKQIKVHADYLNMVKWENKSFKVLEAVRDAYVKAHSD